MPIIVSAGTDGRGLQRGGARLWTLRSPATTAHPSSSRRHGRHGAAMHAARRSKPGATRVNPPSPPIRSSLRLTLRADARRGRNACDRRCGPRSCSTAAPRPSSKASAKSPQALRPGGRLPGAVQLDHAAAFDATAMALKPNGRAAQSCSPAVSSTTGSSTTATPAVRPRPTGSVLSGGARAVAESRSTTARCRNGRREPDRPVAVGPRRARTAIMRAVEPRGLRLIRAAQRDLARKTDRSSSSAQRSPDAPPVAARGPNARSGGWRRAVTRLAVVSQ